MRRAKAILIISMIITSTLFFSNGIHIARASVGESKVYVVLLNDVSTYDSWVDDFSEVKNGVIDACRLKGDNIDMNVPLAHPKPTAIDYPPYYGAPVYVVQSWSEYKNIVENGSNIIIVNTHGQYLPVPYGYTKFGWVDTIAHAMLNHGVIWVHVGGCPFHYVKYEYGNVETWAEGGFKYLMSFINKGDTSCQPPPGMENEHASTRLNFDQRVGPSWFFYRCATETGPIDEYKCATLGRPLKAGDFNEYLIMPMFQFQDYYAAAVIAFVKTSSRYNDSISGGAYVHIGARSLYNADGGEYNSDFGRGFIGTAAALWIECSSFGGRADSRQNPYYFGVENATLCVIPVVIGTKVQKGNFVVELAFAIYGVTQCGAGDVFYFDGVHVFIDEVYGSEWENVTMRVDPGYSREGAGGGLSISGLYDEEHADYGLLPNAVVWLAGVPGLMTGHIASFILFCIGGVQLLAEWASQSVPDPISGVANFARWIEFHYYPLQSWSVRDGKNYYEFMTMTHVELAIPMTDTSGWCTLPLFYHITGVCNWGLPGGTSPEVNDTLNLVIYLNPYGQEDAGIEGDASNDIQNARNVPFPGTYHGYLGGCDGTDWFTFKTGYAGPLIGVAMTPPQYVDFDLELRRQDGSTFFSHNGPGVKEQFLFAPNFNETIKIRVYSVSGSGVYLLQLWCQGGGGCPTLFVWNGFEYMDEGILEIHAESDITIQKPLDSSPALKHGLYNFQLRELDSFTSHIDQVKLYAVDANDNWHICPLISARQNGTSVLLTLFLDDSRRTDLVPTEVIDLKFMQSIPQVEAKYFVFEINGFNQKMP